MRCFICGSRVGDMEVHDEYICERQQKKNENNLIANGAIRSMCPWCGLKTGHENDCPNYDRKPSCVI